MLLARGPSTPTVNARATRARSARPATVTLSRTAALAISAPPSRRPAPVNSRADIAGYTLDSAAYVKPEHAPTRPVRGRP
jgi:hypothetical protein